MKEGKSAPQQLFFFLNLGDVNKDSFLFFFLLKFRGLRGEAAGSTEWFRSLRCRFAAMSNANPAWQTGGGPPGEQWRTMENNHFQLTADRNRTSSKHKVVLSRSKRTDALCVAFFFPNPPPPAGDTHSLLRCFHPHLCERDSAPSGAPLPAEPGGLDGKGGGCGGGVLPGNSGVVVVGAGGHTGPPGPL